MISVADITTFIDENLLRVDGKLKPCPHSVWWSTHNYTEIYTAIISITGFLKDPLWPQQIWHIRNSVFTEHRCLICKTPLKWNVSLSAYPTYCSKKCSSNAPLKLAKFTETCVAKYGVTAPSKSSIIQDVRRKNSIEKHGVPSYSLTDEFKCKIKATMQNRYGVDNIMHLPGISESILSTNMQRYGVKHALCLDEYKDKQKQTNILKYGGNSPSCDAAVREKQSNSTFDRYGVYNIQQLSVHHDSLTLLNDKEYLLTSLKTQTATDIASDLSVDVTTVINYLKKHDIHAHLQTFSRSKQERDFENFLIANNIAFIINDRSVIAPKELDFYIPSLNIAVELCGVYWHSEISGNKPRSYHYNKWKQCNDKGVMLLTYFDDEFYKCKNIIESKILYACGISTAHKIGAREVTISSVANVDEFEFLNKHHIQGMLRNRNFSYGAYYDNKLVGVITLTRRQQYIEITRFSTDTSYIIRGLFSKMVKHFAKASGYIGDIVSFSDNCHGNGNVYAQSGFTVDKALGPGYYYTMSGAPRENRQGYMKSKIRTKFKVDIADKTEWTLMQEQGYDRVWDCGKIKWIMNINKDTYGKGN